MPLKKRLIETGLSFFLFIVAAICLVFAPSASANPSLLRQSIIDYNLESYRKSLSDGSYKGAAGILLMKPEVARSFGLKALINQDYIKARELNSRGKLLFARAVSAITTRKKEKSSGAHSKRAGNLALESKKPLARPENISRLTDQN